MEKPGSRMRLFAQGVRDGIPIALGYFAVAFSLGIAARNAGLMPMEGFLASFLCSASAGEHALFTLIAAGAGYMETALVSLVTNARYFLMSCALSQKFAPETPLLHRVLIGTKVTDELFGLNIARPRTVQPAYSYGAMLLPVLFWAAGTASGIRMGTLLSPRIVSALSVALYGMFLAVIIPPARKSAPIAVCVAAGFLFSLAAQAVPLIAGLSEGTRTILLTVGIASAAALLFPVKEA
ncbi:MAG: AzlC family ABC transporter permease [Lachnospiraceae bacterium]|nr:AzlC family ABC transporter permease [Lachnospiraceae bacterium]